ncbi:MAG: hypothetical protein CMC15_14235 [Flavobacteriaceae bacterium]|nr:hypothetical protein [Flavobacteriaceae bacterium]
MITCLDIENTFTKTDSMPYNGNNTLVSCGYLTDSAEQEYLCFFHAEEKPTRGNVNILQNVLYRTNLLIGHNIKYDLQWLLACGFKYQGELWDTMGVEYLLARGLHRELSLEASCKRRNVSEKKSYIFDEFLKAGKGVDEIPWNKLVEYGEQDVKSTYELAHVQAEMLDIDLRKWAKNENSS